MDITAVIAAVVTGILGIGGIAVFFGKYMPVFAKWVALAKDAVETLNDISVALSPDDKGKVELTADEITKINTDVAAFKTQLAVLIGK